VEGLAGGGVGPLLALCARADGVSGNNAWNSCRTEERGIRSLHDLFDTQQLTTIEQAPLFIGLRHPTWFPPFSENARAVDHLVHVAARGICLETDGKMWLTTTTFEMIHAGGPTRTSCMTAG